MIAERLPKPGAGGRNRCRKGASARTAPSKRRGTGVRASETKSSQRASKGSRDYSDWPSGAWWDHAAGRYRPKHQGSVNLLRPIIVLDQGRRRRQRKPIVLSRRREPSRAPDWRWGKRAGFSRLSVGQTYPRCVSDIYRRATSPQVARACFQ